MKLLLFISYFIRIRLLTIRYKIFYRNYIIIIHENILENLQEFQRNENI